MSNEEIIRDTENLRLLYTQYANLIKEILKEYNSKEKKHHQIITANILQRIYTSIKAINILLGEFYVNKNFKFPIGIQIRVALLDVITLAYLTLHIDDNDEKIYKEQVTRLDNNLVRDYFKEIELKFKNKNIDIIERDRKLKFIYKTFPNNLLKDGKTIELNTKILNLTANGMAKKLIETHYALFQVCYQLYQYYSKYEHFQSISKKFLDEDPEYDFDKLKLSSIYVFQASLMACNIMKVEQSKLLEMKILFDKISILEPTFKNT
jgi:hypothetical protein